MREEDGKPQDIRERSTRYALRAIKFYQSLLKGKDSVGVILGKQYLRSATSIGANVEEAQSAESRADFIHKYGVSRKEANESLYWLRLLTEAEVVSRNRLAGLMQETEELVAVITAIIVSAKKKNPRVTS